MGEAAARLLDLSRLVSRVGRGAHTGIDRVEAAYLTHFLNDDTPLFALVRSSFGFTLFDRAGTKALAARMLGDTPWGRPDLLSRLFLKASREKRGAEADLRRLAIARSGRRLLAQTFVRHLPPKTTWVNVGHSNLVVSVFDAVHALPEGRAAVMVHDTIPLDYPDWQREGTVESFEARMRQVATKADLVIHTSEATRVVTEAHFSEFGRIPEGVTAHLGIDVPVPKPQEVPTGVRLGRPYFVVLGTIEPRKNHALLLDVWAELASDFPSEDMPRLMIVGRRGWKNEALFERLDRQPAQVRELGALSDGAMAALLNGAQALLMPSFMEGFGLPPGEALSLGCPVVASDLPVYREVFGNNIIYLPPTDRYVWHAKVRELIETRREERVPATGLPTWEGHFNQVSKCL